MTWDKLKESVFLTAKATAMVCWLFVGSWTFASVFSYLGGHDLISHWVIGMDFNHNSIFDFGTIDYFYTWLAARVVRNINYICSNFSSIIRAFWSESLTSLQC